MAKAQGQITVILEPENEQFMETHCQVYRWSKTDFINQALEALRACMNIAGAIRWADISDEERAALVEKLIDQAEDLVPQTGRHKAGVHEMKGVHPSALTEEELNAMPPSVAQQIREMFPRAGTVQKPTKKGGKK